MQRSTTRRPPAANSRGRGGRRRGGPPRPKLNRVSLSIPWIDETQARLHRFCVTAGTAAKTGQLAAVRDARVESRRLYEAMEGLRPWLHEGHFSRMRRQSRKVRRLLSPIHEKDRMLDMIQQLLEEGAQWAPLEQFIPALEESRKEAVERAREKLGVVRLPRLLSDFTRTLTDLHGAPPSNRGLASHLAPLIARRRDRFVEAMALSVQEGPQHGTRLLIDLRKLRHMVEMMGTIPLIDSREAQEALDIVGRFLEDWWDAGLIEAMLSDRMHVLLEERGKKKEATELRRLLGELREGRMDYMERAWLSVDSTGLRKALREIVRLAVREAQPERGRWR